MIGRTAAFLHVDKEHFKKFRDAVSGAAGERGFLYMPEFTLKRKDGSIFYSEHSVVPLQDENNVSKGWVSVVRDITERKKNEMALLDSAEKIKLFAYSVIHDLKSPAIGLYGLTKLLRKNYANSLDERGKNYCKQILQTSRQMTSLVEKINQFISTKEFPLNIENIRLFDICDSIRNEFSRSLRIRKVRWSGPREDVELQADRMSLLRVLRNFVDNALKYGGKDLANISIKHFDTGEHHIISVRDDGIGVRAEDFDGIFKPFERRNGSRRVEGAGLGLTIVKEIAEKHGGSVWIVPGAARGTSFCFSLPKRFD